MQDTVLHVSAPRVLLTSDSPVAFSHEDRSSNCVFFFCCTEHTCRVVDPSSLPGLGDCPGLPAPSPVGLADKNSGLSDGGLCKVHPFWSTTGRRYACNARFHNGASIFQTGLLGRPIPVGGPSSAHVLTSGAHPVPSLSFPADTRN